MLRPLKASLAFIALFIAVLLASLLGIGIWLYGKQYDEIGCLSAYRDKLPLTIHGVKIHYCYHPQVFFSNAWLQPPISGQGEQVNLEDALRVVPAIEAFVRSYNATFLEANLQDIYLLGAMVFYGEHYGGTYTAHAVFIEVGSEKENYTVDFVTSQLHAEFSSILMKNYPFPSSTWNNINDHGFKYSQNDVQMLGQPGLYDQHQALLKQGFLNKYSTTNLENDFNDIAFELFTQAPHLCFLAKGYEKIREKVNLAVTFYRRIDPQIKLEDCYKDLK